MEQYQTIGLGSLLRRHHRNRGQIRHRATRGTRLSSLVNNLAFFPYLIAFHGFRCDLPVHVRQAESFHPSLYGTFALLVLVERSNIPIRFTGRREAMSSLAMRLRKRGLYGDSLVEADDPIIFPHPEIELPPGYLCRSSPACGNWRYLSCSSYPRIVCSPPCCFNTTRRGGTSMRTPSTCHRADCADFQHVINKVTGASIDKGIGG